MNQLKDIRNIVIAILITYVIFLQQCSNHKCPNPSENTITSTITKTVYDTIPFNYPNPITIKPEIPKPQIVYLPSDTNHANPLNFYTKEFEDSLLKGTLFSEVDGELLEWKFDYTPKFPKYIDKTVTITNTVTAKKRNLLFITGSVGGNASAFYTDFGLSLYQKKGYLYGLSYDPINRIYKGNIGIQLNNRN